MTMCVYVKLSFLSLIPVVHMCGDNMLMVCFRSMTGTVQDSHRLSVKTWTEEESDRADSTLSRYVCY